MVVAVVTNKSMASPSHRKLLFAAALLLMLGGACWWFMSDPGKRETTGSLPPGEAERGGRGTLSSPEQEGRSQSAPPPGPGNAAKAKPVERAKLLGDQWRITTGAAEAAGLTDEERAKAQEVVDRMKREMEDSVKERLVPDEAASDPSKDILAYKISALPDRGADFLHRYKTGFQAAVGEKKGAMLYGALETSIPFGGFGQYDLDLKFYPSSRSDAAGKHDLEWVTRDPVTKAALWTSGAVNEVVDRFWGNAFK